MFVQPCLQLAVKLCVIDEQGCRAVKALHACCARVLAAIGCDRSPLMLGLLRLYQVTTEEDLEIIFSRFGKITSCDIIRDYKTGAPRDPLIATGHRIIQHLHSTCFSEVALVCCTSACDVHMRVAMLHCKC